MTARLLLVVILMMMPSVSHAADALITSWASGHGWTRPAGTATVTDDTSIYYVGGRSLKVVTAGGGVIDKIRKSPQSPTIDMSSKFFKVIVRVSDWTKINTLRFYASSDDFQNYYGCDLLALGRKYANNTWVSITLPWSACANEEDTSPVRTAINALQFNVVDTGSAVTINFGGLYSVSNAHTGFVTFAFDDGYIEHRTVAGPKLAEYGYSGSIFPIWEYFGLWNTYISVSQLQELRTAYGWDVGYHSDVNWTTLSYDGVQAELWNMRGVLQRKGLSEWPRIAAYPYGGVNATVLSALSNTSVRLARTTIDTNETSPPSSPLLLREVMILNTTSVDAIKARLDAGMTNKEWVILTYHHIQSPAVEDVQTTPANFNAIVDYVHTKGYPVRTFSQMLRGLDARAEGLGPFVSTSQCGGRREDFWEATSRNDFFRPIRISYNTNCQRH